MKIQFSDIMQCADGPLTGLLAQVTSVTDSEVELLSRDMDGTPHVIRVTAAEIPSWRHTLGQAIRGPKQQPKPISEPVAATEVGVTSVPNTGTGATGSPDEAPARSSLLPEPLNVESLLEPLPPSVKIGPMIHEAPPAAAPAPVWDMDDPEPTPEENPKVRYSALVTNGKGQETRVEYSLRKGLPPERYAGIPVKMAKKFIEDVAPITVQRYTPLP